MANARVLACAALALVHAALSRPAAQPSVLAPADGTLPPPRPRPLDESFHPLETQHVTMPAWDHRAPVGGPGGSTGGGSARHGAGGGAEGGGGAPCSHPYLKFRDPPNHALLLSGSNMTLSWHSCAVDCVEILLRVAGASPTPLVPAGPNKLTATFELPKLPGEASPAQIIVRSTACDAGTHDADRPAPDPPARDDFGFVIVSYPIVALAEPPSHALPQTDAAFKCVEGAALHIRWQSVAVACLQFALHFDVGAPLPLHSGMVEPPGHGACVAPHNTTDAKCASSLSLSAWIGGATFRLPDRLPPASKTCVLHAQDCSADCVAMGCGGRPIHDYSREGAVQFVDRGLDCPKELVAGEPTLLTWGSPASVTHVTLHLLSDGALFATLLDAVPNTGNATIVIPLAAADSPIASFFALKIFDPNPGGTWSSTCSPLSIIGGGGDTTGYTTTTGAADGVGAKELLHEGTLRGFEQGYSAGFRQGMYGYAPAWFTGRNLQETAEFYFNQLRRTSASMSADELESDLSGGLNDY